MGTKRKHRGGDTPKAQEKVERENKRLKPNGPASSLFPTLFSPFMKLAPSVTQPTQSPNNVIPPTPATQSRSMAPLLPTPTLPTKGDDLAKRKRVDSSPEIDSKWIEKLFKGDPPQLSIDEKAIRKRIEPIGISDIRNLTLHLLGVGPHLPWVSSQGICRVVTLFVPGITPELLGLPNLVEDQERTNELSSPSSSSSSDDSDSDCDSESSTDASSTTPTTPTTSDPDLLGRSYVRHNRVLTLDPSCSFLPHLSRTFARGFTTLAPGSRSRIESVSNEFIYRAIDRDRVSHFPMAPDPTSTPKTVKVECPSTLVDMEDMERKIAQRIAAVESAFSNLPPTPAPTPPRLSSTPLLDLKLQPQSPPATPIAKLQPSPPIPPSTHQHSTTSFLMTKSQMKLNSFPLPSYMDPEGWEHKEEWVETPREDSDPSGGFQHFHQYHPIPVSMPFAKECVSGAVEEKGGEHGEGEEKKPRKKKKKKLDPKEGPKVYAVDCEMCLTGEGSELTRVSVVDFDTNELVYDRLVRPRTKIRNYLTQYSGITPQMMVGVTTTLSDVQTFILSIISPTPTRHTAILLGHSLDSDLRALKLRHPLCIDTSVLYHHPQDSVRKAKLRWLAMQWCGKEIQNRGGMGHDSAEDARACVELLRRKIIYGRGFGLYHVEKVSIFEDVNGGAVSATLEGEGKAGIGIGNGSGIGKEVRTRRHEGKRCAYVDCVKVDKRLAGETDAAICCLDDGAVVDAVARLASDHQFVFGRMQGLACASGWWSGATMNTDPVPRGQSQRQRPPAAVIEASKMLDERIWKLCTEVDRGTAVVVFTGHDDPRPLASLAARKCAEGAGWTASEEKKLERAVERARKGLVFVHVVE